MRDSRLLLKNVAVLGHAYCDRHLAQERDKVEAHWFEGLRFIFARSFMRGRRDELSNEYLCFTLDRLANDFFRLNDDGSAALRGRADEFDLRALRSFKERHGLGRKSACSHERFADEVAERHDLIRLLTTEKSVRVFPLWGEPYLKHIRLNNDLDLAMVLDVLRFAAGTPDGNGYAYLREQIRAHGVPKAYAELMRLWGVKDKIAGLIIRDIGLLNPGLIGKSFELAFPVDTLVRQLARKLGCTAEDDAGIKAHFIEKCLESALDPPLLAAGLWYLGANSLEILLDHFVGRYALDDTSAVGQAGNYPACPDQWSVSGGTQST